MEVEYKNIDPKLIVNEIRNGRSIEAVQKLFGLRFKSEVQDLYMKGLMELGEIPPVNFTRKKKSQAAESHATAEPAVTGIKPETRTRVQPPVNTPVHTIPEQHNERSGVVNTTHQNTVPPVQPVRQEIKVEKARKPVVIRKRERKPGILIKTNNFRTIGQSGSVTLNKTLLIDQLKFSVGDTFEIYREDDRIILQKVENPPL